MTKVVSWKVKVEGSERSIQLYDSQGNPISGKGAFWEGDFNCTYNQLTSLEGAPESVGEIGRASCRELTVTITN